MADARCDLEGTLWLCCGSQDDVQLCCSIVSAVKNKKYLETVKLVMIFLLVSDVECTGMGILFNFYCQIIT